MDFSTLSPYIGPVGVAALLALYGLASLAKSNRDASGFVEFFHKHNGHFANAMFPTQFVVGLARLSYDH